MMGPMGSAHEEIDPIKTNPDSHKAIGVVAVFALLVGLGWWLKGSPFSPQQKICTYEEAPPAGCCAAPADVSE